MPQPIHQQLINEIFYRYSTYRISYNKLVSVFCELCKTYPEEDIMSLSRPYTIKDKSLSSFYEDVEEELNHKTHLKVSREGLEDYKFVRYDTIGDGSCFFHSVLTCISDNYNQSTTGEKIDMVKKIRSLLSENVNINTWERLNGEKLMIKEINGFLIQKFSYSQPLVEFLFDCQLKSETFNEYVDYLKENRYARKIVVHMDKIKEHCFLSYINKLSNSSVWVGTEENDVDAIQLFADFLGIDIYVFSVYKKMPNIVPYYTSFSYERDHEVRPSICILNINNTHFEAMGVRCRDKRNRVYTKHLFRSNDEMINKLYNVVNN